jgi:salicylate hydroxylase
VAALSLAVVGAGIGGLTAALALAREGHAVTIVERRTGFSEVGAGLQLSPNASRILLDLGLGPALRRAVTEPERVVIRSIRTGRTIGEVALGSFMKERFGAPYWVIHRADLQQVLLDAVRSEPGIRLRTGRTAQAVTEAPHCATLAYAGASGAIESLAVDGVIGADGIWSTLREALGNAPPAFRGYAVWRTTMPREQAPRELAGNETGLWLGRRRHVVHYPIAGGTLVNIVVIEGSSRPVEGWAAPGHRIKLLTRYNPAAPLLRELLARPQEWLLWSLFDAPARTLARGRVALLGDAAHPVLPFLAQGAALAIEDAATLARTFAAHEDVPRALAAYERQRLERVCTVQDHARRNGRIYHLPGPAALARDLVMRQLGPEGMTERYAWLYGFQVGA